MIRRKGIFHILIVNLVMRRLYVCHPYIIIKKNLSESRIHFL